MSPRAVGGQRLRYEEVPGFVRAWVEAQTGPARVIAEHVGGMSPGCATSLEVESGERFFLKAVGRERNERTVEIFRAEIAILPLLPRVSYRPGLVGCFDQDGWTAVLLTHVEGRYPDLDEAQDFAALAEAYSAQSTELSPPPPGVPRGVSIADNARRWRQRWEHVASEPGAFLPPWATARLGDLLDRVRRLPGQLPADSLCHCDGRDDNALVRPDGSAVLLDWGMWRLGPWWLDRALLAVQMSDATGASRWLDSWLPAEDEEAVTNLLVAFGGAQAWRATQADHPLLPAMAEYCREDARRFLALAELRLGGG